MDISNFITTIIQSTRDVDDKDVSPLLASGEKISPDLAFAAFENIAKFNAHAEGSFMIELFNDVTDNKNKDGVEDKTIKHWPNINEVYSNGALLGYS